MRFTQERMRIAFLLPGHPATRTGGYGYDRAIVAGLRAAGWVVDQPPLPDAFPWPGAAARAAAARQVAQLRDGALVVADGLAFGALPELAERHAERLRWVALVHHPLAQEAGLSAAQRQALFDSERRALACARAVIVTSAATARALSAYGVPAARVRVVPPGTVPVAGAGPRPAGDAPLLLCVATLTPRKGHALLIEALAALRHRPWTLHCAGSTSRDPATAAAVRQLIAARGLADRVTLHGELADAQLDALYRRADAAVLATSFEGYGMALAEAMAHGLPVVSTTAGAIPDLVPPSAGLLVPPDDAAALRGALAMLLDDAALRARLAAGARAAAQMLPTWPQSVAAFAAALAAVEAVGAVGAVGAVDAAGAVGVVGVVGGAGAVGAVEEAP
jgi:glycosyltransferase involved in cell wall biosynthesis